MPSPTAASRVIPSDWSSSPDLLDGDAEAREVPRSPVLLGTAKPEEAEISHQLDRFQWHLVRRVPSLDMGSEIASSEVRHRSPEIVVFLAERKRAGHKTLFVVADPASIA